MNEQWIPGEALPSEIKLAEEYKVSRVTIRQAIELLVNEGLLYRVKGSGTYVKEKRIERNIYELTSFTEQMAKLNKVPSNKILEFQMTDPDDNIKRLLNLDDGEKVFFVSRLRCMDGTPVILEDTYLPVRLFPNLSYEVMRTSKYEYIEKEQKLKIKQSYQEIIPILPDHSIKKHLNLDKTIPILKIKLWSILEDNTPFEYTEVYFKSDEYKFTIVAQRS